MRRMVPVNRVENPMRAQANFRRHFKLIWAVQSFRKKFSLNPSGKSALSLATVPPGKGALRGSSRTRVGMRWTRQRRARGLLAGRSAVSDSGAQDERRVSGEARTKARRSRWRRRVAYGKTVWSRHPLLVPSCRWRRRSDRIRSSHQAGSDGDKTNSSPGRTRHKP